MSAVSGKGSLYNKIAWRIMPILFIGYIIAYLDRVNVGFA
jgi:sugar phosphate permease